MLAQKEKDKKKSQIDPEKGKKDDGVTELLS
jgi:hypothetical protein